MKTISALIFAAILTLTLAGSKVCSGQIVAIGHVTAEVIESVSAASEVITNFEIGNITSNELKTMKSSDLTSKPINLGTITVNSGRNITCNVVVKNASLSDTAGNGFTLEPTVKNSSLALAAQSNGSQTIQLDGKANIASSQTSGLYQGSYTVVIAYN